MNTDYNLSSSFGDYLSESSSESPQSTPITPALPDITPDTPTMTNGMILGDDSVTE